MSLLKSIIQAQGGKVLQQVAGNFGLDRLNRSAAPLQNVTGNSM